MKGGELEIFQMQKPVLQNKNKKNSLIKNTYINHHQIQYININNINVFYTLKR